MEVQDLYNSEGHLRDDAEEILDQYFQVHNERFHQMLFWTNIAIMINLIFVILRLLGLKADASMQLHYLTSSLVGIAIGLAAFLYAVWRSDTKLGPEDWAPAKQLLQYKIAVMDKQAKLIVGYLIAYSLVLTVTYCYYRWTGLVRDDLVFRSTSSVSLVMYGFGAYSLKICLTRRFRLVRERNAWPADMEKDLPK